MIGRPVRQQDLWVLVHLIDLHARTGRVTMRSLAAECGSNNYQAYESMKRLRELGLIAWEEGTKGTTRPCVYVETFWKSFASM